jgi:hypothetical protein
MKKALSLLPVLALSANLGFAQAPHRTRPSDNSGPVSNDQPNRGASWGWIGLIGLAGLAGLGGRKRADMDRESVRMRPAA